MADIKGSTGATFAALSTEQRARALNILNDLGATPEEHAARRAIAYAVAECRCVQPTLARSWTGLLGAINGVAKKYKAPGEPADLKNMINFVQRQTDKPSTDTVGLCALFAWDRLDSPDGAKLREHCLGDQLRLLEWVRGILRTGVKATKAPGAPSTAGGDQGGGDIQSLARQWVDGNFEQPLSDDDLRSRLNLAKGQHQVGYLCFRSALSRPRTIVQSYLTILAPERSRIPFFTFAHVYERQDEAQLRAAGGLVLTTRSALYLVGAEGWIDREHANEPGSIFRYLKPLTLTMYAIPWAGVSAKTRILHGIALAANGDDNPIVSRVALRTATATTHDGCLHLVGVEDFTRHLAGMADTGIIEVQGRKAGPLVDVPAKERRSNPLTKEADEILTAINNRPEGEFLDATAKDNAEVKLSHGQILDQINKIFVANGQARYLAPDGTAYGFDVHRWFNALDTNQEKTPGA